MYVESGSFRKLIEFFQPLMFVSVTIRDLKYYLERDEFPCHSDMCIPVICVSPYTYH